jgi:beta-aspartyl-peptidase (threonine type)
MERHPSPDRDNHSRRFQFRLGMVFLIGALALVPAVPGYTSWRCRSYRPVSPCPLVEVPVIDEKAEIRTVLDAQVAAWNKGDLEGFMAGYWSSPELTFVSGGNRTQGWQGTLERYRKRYQAEGQEMGKLTFSDLEVELLGADAAFVRGRFQLERSKDRPTGLFTLVFRKFPEGWRIIHDHTSS